MSTPLQLVRFFRRSYSGPGVYRWATLENDILTTAYIGEAENLCRRLGGYLNPGKGQRTNIRIKKILDEKKVLNATIYYQVLEFEDFEMNRFRISRDGLTNPYTRRLIENLAIVLHTFENCTLLNRGMDLIDIVEWNSEAGSVRGTIIKRVVSDTRFKRLRAPWIRLITLRS
jgi:hypothetical protein